MTARIFSTWVAVSLVVHSAAAFADPPAEDAPEMPPPRVVLVDYASIATGILPPFPSESSAPAAAPSAPVSDLEVDVVAQGPRKPSPKRLHRKKRIRPSKGSKDVEIKAVGPVLGLLYMPSNDSTDFNGDTTQRMSCGADQQGIVAVRWEKVLVGKADDARLEIADLWFDRKTCSLGSGSTMVVPIKAIAWNDGRPWLYAVRSETSVTFVMPQATETSADSMAGAPLTIRGGFTRVTLPLGRWGASSMVAQVPSLLFEAPKSTASTKSQKASHTPEGVTESGPTQVAVELVQTMSELHPTLVVRTQSPDAVVSLRSFE